MNGQDRYETSIFADQSTQAFPDLGGRVTIVSKHQYTVWIFALDPDQIGDTMDQHACLTRSRPREHKHIGLFTVVTHDLLLCRIPQIVDDLGIGLRRCLPFELRNFPRHPSFHEVGLIHCKIVMREPLGLINFIDTFGGISRHHVGLDGLFAVVVFKRCEMLGGKAAAFRVDVQCVVSTGTSFPRRPD